MILSRFFKSSKSAQSTPVTQATGKALKEYGKTFRDLARYDRGELDPVSH